MFGAATLDSNSLSCTRLVYLERLKGDMIALPSHLNNFRAS